MKVAFIAGPYRAATPWQVELNIRKAEMVGFEVAKLGIMPLIPHTNTRFFDKTLTDDFWLDGTSELLKRCDMVVLVDEWATTISSGTKAEVVLAESLGIDVYDSLEHLRKTRK